MPVSVSVDVSRIDTSRLVRSGSPVDRAMLRAGEYVASGARAALTAAGRVDTGRLRSSIRVTSPRVEQGGQRVRVTVGTDVDYAVFQHEGVRPFGPRRARFLVFVPKGASAPVFAQRVRGFPGVPFLRIGLQQLQSRGLR